MLSLALCIHGRKVNNGLALVLSYMFILLYIKRAGLLMCYRRHEARSYITTYIQNRTSGKKTKYGQTDRKNGRPTNRHTYLFTYIHIYRQTDRRTDRSGQAGRSTSIHSYRQAGRQTRAGKQIGRQTERYSQPRFCFRVCTMV